MAFSFGASRINSLYEWLDDPPPVFDVEKRFNKDLHDEVYRYAMSHFFALAQDTVSDNWRKNCTEFAQWYLGTENTIKTYDELEIRQVNLLQMYGQIKHSKLLSDRLKVHYVAKQNQSWEFAQAMNQLFDWHAMKIRRNRLQQRIELCAPLFGTVGVLYTPKWHWRGGEKELIPADWEYLDPRTMFFEPRWDRDEDIPVFAIRTIGVGRLEDAVPEHKKILKQRDLDQFERGGAMFSDSPEILDATENIPMTTRNYLSKIDASDVEIIRIWIKDLRTHKRKRYFPEYLNAETGELDPETMTEAVQKAFKEADSEFGNIIEDDALPFEGEHHWAHYVRHRQQAEESGESWNETQFAFMENHMDAHLQAQKKQPPDAVDKDADMFKGGWRFIKIIGRQVITDGSINFDYEQFPVALFHNLINPESLIGISDIENLLVLQDDLNGLISDEMAISRANAYPTRIEPERLKDEEFVKQGPLTRIFVKDAEEAVIIRNLEAPRNAGTNRELMMILQQFMQMVTGASQAIQGQTPSTRTSGAGIMALQQQGMTRYTATQYSLNDGWERSATIWLAQMKQFWTDEIMLPPIGPEYQDSVKILNSNIDPSAYLQVERISQDRNIQEEAGTQALQLSMMLMSGGVPLPAVLELLATNYDGSVASRVSAQLMRIMQKPENQQRMQEQEAQQRIAAMQGNQKATR